jgi:hypothetical protein
LLPIAFFVYDVSIFLPSHSLLTTASSMSSPSQHSISLVILLSIVGLATPIDKLRRNQTDARKQDRRKEKRGKASSISILSM